MPSSNTAGNTKAKPRGKPFVKGDKRINRKGRPKSFDALRELALQIAHEKAQVKGEDVIVSGRKATITEMILRQWATSKNAQLQRGFLEIAYGKVPDQVDVTTKGESLNERGVDTKAHRRAVSLLTDAFRGELADSGHGESGGVGANEQATARRDSK